ncbi:hypothetical protein [Parasitella parasitica]|uniref:Uncharacterized protein n=1 Tax=Parasitella parasitica TaxID=35722 RepID=A0A0B7NQK2_9FUNG|nr:hypothetical protein [Parasitella parasitica]
MGNSASKTKAFSLNLRNKISQTTGDMQEISASQRNKPTDVDKDKHSEPKVSILKDNGFLTPAKKTKTPKKSSSKKSKYKKVIVTKSIIGKPTNFKHLNCSSKIYTNDIDNDATTTESPSLEAQMVALAALIKPLPKDTTKEKELPQLPVIPPRNSSYGNHIYLEQYAALLPSPPSSVLSSPDSSYSSSFFSTEMQHNIPSTCVNSKKKSKHYYPSIKKDKKTFIKYASIGKGPIARKQKAT